MGKATMPNSQSTETLMYLPLLDWRVWFEFNFWLVGIELQSLSYLRFNPGSKSFTTIRSCSFSYFQISSYMLISLRNLMTFVTSHSIPSIFFMSFSMPCLLLSSFHWGQSCRQCLVSTYYVLAFWWLFVSQHATLFI